MAFIKKRSAKSWSVVYDYIDAEGVKRKKWESGFTTQQQAKARKAEIEHEQASRQFVVPDKMTVSELFDKVINIYGTQNWQPGTYESNSGLIRNHINTTIGHLPIQKVTPLDIENMFTELRSKKVMRGKGDDRPYLSSTTLRLTHNILNKGFKLAVEWKLLKENPVKMAPPKRDTAEASIWTPDVMFHALGEMREQHEQLYLAAHTSFVCAMRIGEAVGLQWSCVDFRNDLITINKTLQRVNKNTVKALALEEKVYIFPTVLQDMNSVLILKQPKTKGSNRTIRIPPRLKHDLLMRKQLIAKQKAYYGKEYQDHDLVFCLDDGRPIEPKLCQKWFTKFQKRSESEYPAITFHEIRHSVATFLVILSGGNPAAVQKVTGHQSPDILLRIYNHATKGMVNELAQRFEDVFYSLDVHSIEDSLCCQGISDKQIAECVSRFDQSTDQSPFEMLAVCTQPQKLPSQEGDIENFIHDALAKDPTLREKLLLKLMMQPAQIMRE